MKVLGTGIVRLRLTLAVIGALTAPVLFYAGRRGLGRWEGLIAGFVAAMYGPLVFADGLVEKEGLAALIAATALFLTAFGAGDEHRHSGKQGLRDWRGVLWCFYARNAILIAPFAIVWWLAIDGIRHPARLSGFWTGLLRSAHSRRSREWNCLSFS